MGRVLAAVMAGTYMLGRSIGSAGGRGHDCEPRRARGAAIHRRTADGPGPSTHSAWASGSLIPWASWAPACCRCLAGYRVLLVLTYLTAKNLPRSQRVAVYYVNRGAIDYGVTRAAGSVSTRPRRSWWASP